MRTGIHNIKRIVLRSEVETVRGTHPTWLLLQELRINMLQFFGQKPTSGFLYKNQYQGDQSMKSFRLFLVLSAMLLSVFCTPASATQIICLINNSSHAIKIEGTGVGAATIEYEAHGGDKNRCWHVDQSANSLDFVRTYTKNSAGQWQDSGVERFDFQNLPLGKAYWFTWSSLRHWETYIKICGKEICVYHSPNQDVWRLFVEDRK